MSMDQDEREGIEPHKKSSPFTHPKFLLGATAVALFVAFVLSNLQEVRIEFLWFGVETNLIWALLISAALGAVASWAFSTIRARGARKREELLAKAQLDKKK